MSAPPAWRPPTNRAVAEPAVDRDLGPSPLEKLNQMLAFPKRVYSYYIDRTVPWNRSRWGFFASTLLLYFLRVYVIDGFYIVTYALGIYLLNLLIGFLSPSVDPEEQDGLGEIQLPKSENDEFRPFTRKLPEFQFWFWGTRAVLLSILATFFPILDFPVFWPILLFYFVFLFLITMKEQILHMVKHRYVPWSTGKKGGK